MQEAVEEELAFWGKTISRVVLNDAGFAFSSSFGGRERGGWTKLRQPTSDEEKKAKRWMRLRESRSIVWRAREEEKLDSRSRRATSLNAERWTGVYRGRWFLTLTLD